MFPRRIHICDTFGIPVYLDFSFIILLLIFAMQAGSLAKGISFALLLAVSVTMHELGHALTARSFGYRTNDITLSLLGGCASLIALPRKAWQEFLTAVAGPAVSFAIGLGAFFCIKFLADGSVLSMIWHYFTDSYDLLTDGTMHYLQSDGKLLISWKASSFSTIDTLTEIGLVNLMLGAFNLLPGFPMDGGRVFRSTMRIFMSRTKATYVAMIVGRVTALAIGIFGLYRIIFAGGWGFISILIAWMIWREGWREYQMALAEEAWGRWDYSARVSPPPYGGDGDETEIRRN